jgi:POT family proton-dependent oligopeptide transporter
MFKNHPKGLIILSLANMGERFGYYTMLAILTLYLQAKFGLSSSATSVIYGSFLALVYFLPLFGGIIADKVLGYGKTILLGVVVMFSGYLLLALPSENNVAGKAMAFCALAFIAIGTGFFKGNLQALVGNLYEAQQYRAKRDVAFSIFYMFINIGAFFAPSAANAINNSILAKDNFTYDASIPKNYVALNDRVVDEKTFLDNLFATKKFEKLSTKADSTTFIQSEKKKQGVVFQSDRDKNLFKLKAAGLNQLTAAGIITDPAQQLSKQEYELLESKKPSDQKNIVSIKQKINDISIIDSKINPTGDPDKFAIDFGQKYVVNSLSKSYNIAFGVACISLILSLLVFLGFRKTWKPVDKTLKQQLKEAKDNNVNANVIVLTKAQVKERVIALLLVFFVVIFFWMSFHQNGLCLTFFARDYTQSNISPLHNIIFSLPALLSFLVFAYGIYISTIGLFEGKRNPKQGIIVSLVGLAGLILYYLLVVKNVTGYIKITPQIFQQFNPLFIVLLTPVTVALFSFLNKRGKEPSAPKKIGIGMLLAAIAFMIILFVSIGLPAPGEIQGISNTLVNPNWLISTYFVLTIAELFLSPMGLSFVAKVAPPQYKGLMQGGWLAATAIGNYFVGVLGTFWDKLPLYMFWGVLVICCSLSALFIFSILKRLENATTD